MESRGSCRSAKVKTAVSLITLLANISYVMTQSPPYDTGAGLVYRLDVTQDVTLERGTANFNYLDYLIVGKHPQFPNKRSLIQFQDLSKECEPEHIKWAKMYIFYVYAHKASWHTIQQTPHISRPVEIYQVNKPWDEAITTSTVRLSGTNWGTPWLDITGTDAGPNKIDIISIWPKRPQGFVEWDVTEAVRNWRSGTPNNGLLLRAQNEADLGRDIRFFSNAYGDATKHAFINVLCDKCDNSADLHPEKSPRFVTDFIEKE